MLPALFFDLDGTLVDSERQHWQAWRAAILPLGLDLSWDQYEKEAIGLPDPEILSRLARKLPDRFDHVSLPVVLGEKKQRFTALVHEQTPISQETIGILREVSHLQLALVTSSSRVEAFGILNGAGIMECFRAIVCLDDVHRPKPHPEPYLLAMQRLAVNHGIAFEDSTSGRASARAAGLEVIDVSVPSELPSLLRCRLSLPASHIMDITSSSLSSSHRSLASRLPGTNSQHVFSEVDYASQYVAIDVSESREVGAGSSTRETAVSRPTFFTSARA